MQLPRDELLDVLDEHAVREGVTESTHADMHFYLRSRFVTESSPFSRRG